MIKIEELAETISKSLKRLRKEKGLTIQQLVDALGEEISLRTYKSYENPGEPPHIPDLDKLVLLADYYQVSLDEIVYNRKVTRDDSYTWKDSLNRLGRLIGSNVLHIMSKNDFLQHAKVLVNVDYVFVPADYEVKQFSSRAYSIITQMDNAIVHRKRQSPDWVKELDKQTEDLINGDEQLYPVIFKRLMDQMAFLGIDPCKAFMERIATLNKIG